MPTLTDRDRQLAYLLAKSVRNALEGRLHGDELGDLGLSDEQMRILNSIVRNAIATGLHAQTNYDWAQAARAYSNFLTRRIPDYWEPPELLAEYVRSWGSRKEQDDGHEQSCRLCARPIVNPSGEKWTHLAADGTLVIGCRAASFTNETGWDDTLKVAWKAIPIE